MYRTRELALLGMILVAAVCRLIPHPPNFAPIGAMALFGGACFASLRWALLAPLAAMVLSDMAIGLLSGDFSLGVHRYVPAVYGGFAVMVVLGMWLRNNRNVFSITATVLAGSLLFFVITNFGYWAMGAAYPKTWTGIAECFTAALPFYRFTVMGDALFATVLFGGLAWAERGFPALRETRIVCE